MKETTRRLLIAAVLLVAAVGVAAAAVSTTSVTQNDDGAVLQAGDSGPSVNITGNIDVYPATGTSTDTVQWNTTDGNVTVTSSAHTNITIADTEIVGTWTNATAIDATNGPVTIDPADKRAVTVRSAIDSVAFRASTSADDGVVDFVYSGSSGTSNVTIRTAPASTQLGAVDADTGALLDVATSDASGTIVFDALDNSQHTVLLQTSTGGPILSDESPQGKLANNPTSISVQVNDSDFPGDTVSTSFDLDGSSVGSKSVTSNGTATVSMPSRGQTAGQHTVDVTATDSFGQTTTLSYTYEVPSNITIFNETSPSQKITSATATLRFFEIGDGEVFERTTANGKLDLTGLPVQKDMTVVVEAADFETRRIYLDSIYEQQEVYLLNKTINPTTGDVVFTLSDRTGQFPDSTTTLRVQRALTKDFDGDGNDETRMQTIAGDKFGASGEFPATLVATSVRYRLVIENEQGDRRVLGAYTATGDDSVTLEVGQVAFGEEEVEQGTAFRATMVNVSGQRTVQVTYRDAERATDNLSYEIISPGSAGTLVANRTVQGPFGTFKATHPVPASVPSNVTYEVRHHANRSGAADVGGLQRVGDIPPIAGALGLDPRVLAMASYVSIAAITGLVVVFDDRLAAITGTVVAFVLTLLGTVSIPPLAIGISGAISLLYAVGRVR